VPSPPFSLRNESAWPARFLLLTSKLTRSPLLSPPIPPHFPVRDPPMKPSTTIKFLSAILEKPSSACRGAGSDRSRRKGAGRFETIRSAEPGSGRATLDAYPSGPKQALANQTAHRCSLSNSPSRSGPNRPQTTDSVTASRGKPLPPPRIARVALSDKITLAVPAVMLVIVSRG